MRGRSQMVEAALEMLRRGGRCAAVGIPTVGVEIAMQRLVLDDWSWSDRGHPRERCGA